MRQLLGVREDLLDDDPIHPQVHRFKFDLLVLFQLFHELDERLVADHVHALAEGRLAGPAAKHQAQAAADGLLGQDVGLGAVGPQADDHGDALHVPPFAQHQHADDGIDGAAAVVDLLGGLARRVQIPLGDVACTVGVNDQQLIAGELCGVFGPQVVGHVVGVVGAVQHEEEHRLALERRQLVAILAPSFHARGQVGLVAHAGDVRRRFLDALHDALDRPLGDVVDDRLLERVVEDGPGEQGALAVARGGGDVELEDTLYRKPLACVLRTYSRQAGSLRYNRRVQPADALVPLAVLIVGVMGFIVGDEDRPPAGDDALIEVVRLHGLRRWPRAQHGGHDVRLVVVLGCIVAFVKLLDIGEVDRALRAGALAVPAHDRIPHPNTASTPAG